MNLPKFFLPIVCLCLMCVLATGCTAESRAQATAIPTIAGWRLVWQDEFDGKGIDPANWTYDLGGGGWGNGEAEHYTARPENARIENGNLVIEALQEKYEGSYYTSARLKTQGLQTFQYGRIEARLKVPAGAGLWPAFWMLGSNFDGTNWPDCGEIDIMEYIGREPDLIMGTLHGPGYAGALGMSKWNRQKYNIADDFHTYAIEWDADQIHWFYDGAKYNTITRADIGDREWVFDQPFFIILNLAVGGQLPGPVGLKTTFPAQLLVDYVRVYQQ
jgi:beta-glucanase (GH16 family)